MYSMRSLKGRVQVHRAAAALIEVSQRMNKRKLLLVRQLLTQALKVKCMGDSAYGIS